MWIASVKSRCKVDVKTGLDDGAKSKKQMIAKPNSSMWIVSANIQCKLNAKCQIDNRMK